MADIQRVYWDSCSWIALMNEEGVRCAGCNNVIEQAKARKIQIYTSTLSLAEVYKAKCDDGNKSIQEEREKKFDELLRQSDYISIVQVTYRIGIDARNLLRAYSPSIKKPVDGIHLATAAFVDADELHTYDGNDLLFLDGKVKRKDGQLIKICVPPLPEQPLLPNV